jgi:hypothetical protein
MVWIPPNPIVRRIEWLTGNADFSHLGSIHVTVLAEKWVKLTAYSTGGWLIYTESICL